MVPTTYTPREGSLPDRLIAFFTQQPDEELSIADIVLKFDAKVQSVKMCLKPTVQAGLIRWGQNEDGSWVYTAGPALQYKAQRAAAAAAADAADAADAAAPQMPVTLEQRRQAERTAAKAARASARPEQLDALVVEKGVPLPATGKAKGLSKWQPLLDKLTEPGQSIAIPRTWKTAVAAYCVKVNAQRRKNGQGTGYVCRLTGPDTARVWRLA